MQELHRYLRMCKSEMSVDLFDFDYWVNALSEFTLSERLRKHIVKEVCHIQIIFKKLYFFFV